MKKRSMLLAVGVLATVLLGTPSAEATLPNCSYDGNDVTVDMSADTFVRMFVDVGSEIKAVFVDEGVVDCGDATNANTERVNLEGGASSFGQTFVVTQNGPGGRFIGPSILVEGRAGTDELRFVGTSASDSFQFGTYDENSYAALDLTEPLRLQITAHDIESAVARMLGGGDRVTGGESGGGGSGAFNPFQLPLEVRGQRGPDELVGGLASDDIAGGAGDDLEKGVGGSDDLSGQAGDDNLNGGPGNDECSGGPGDDRLRGCEN